MHSFTRAFDFWKVYSLLMYPCFVISLVLRMVMSYNDKCEDVRQSFKKFHQFLNIMHNAVLCYALLWQAVPATAAVATATEAAAAAAAIAVVRTFLGR